jgi:hypothetical protein
MFSMPSLRSDTGALLTLVMLFCLAGCGGGDGASSGSANGLLPDQQSGSSASPYEIGLDASSPFGQAATTFSASEALTINVTLEDTSGSTATPIVNEPVSLISTVGTVSPSNGTSLTDEAGVAAFEISFSGQAGAGVVTVTYVSPDGPVTSTLNVEALDVPISHAMTVVSQTQGGSSTSMFSRRSPLVVIATITETVNGVTSGLSGEIVSLATDVGNVDPSNGSALTDANGEATFTISFSDVVGAGSIDISATVDGDSLAETINVQAEDEGLPFQLQIVTKDGTGATSSLLSASSPLVIEATLQEIDGSNLTPLEGESVSITATLGSVDPANGSKLTDSSGIATFQLTFDEVVGAGTLTATYEADLGSVITSANIEAVGASSNPPYSIAISLKDAIAGSATDEFSSSTPLKVEVSLTEGATGLPNQLVVLSSSIGVVTPTNLSALTDATGLAIFEIAFNGVTGAGTIEATYTAAEGTVTATANAVAVLPTLKLGYLDAGVYSPGIRLLPTTEISYQGSAAIFLQVIDENDRVVTTDEEVAISSSCIDTASSSLSSPSPVTTTAGAISLTYTATANCVGTDEITATLIQAGQATEITASATLTIQDPGERFITYTRVDKKTIALAGTGGGTNLAERSQVTFTVADIGGTPVEGHEVSFELSTDIGGVELIGLTGFTDANGEVTATIRSGRVATVVRVIATIESSPGVEASVVSDELTITGGLPDQNSISLSAETLSIATAWDTDGVTTTISVHMADRFNNPVPDGTAANFRTEYGTIEGSCTTVAGTCSVLWTSQDPREPLFNPDEVKTISETCGLYSAPGPCPGSSPYTRGGRSTILVTAVGEETFIDANGDGYFDDGENFEELGEAFRDDNEDGVYNPSELFCASNPANARCIAGSEEDFLDYDGSGDYTEALTVDPLYNGLACPEGETYCSRDLILVRDQLPLILSPTDAIEIAMVDLSGPTRVTGVESGKVYAIYFSDAHNNRPATGAEIVLEAEGGCTIPGQTEFTVPNSSAEGAYGIGLNVMLKAGDLPDPPHQIIVRITNSSGGNTLQRNFSCQVPDPPP